MFKRAARIPILTGIILAALLFLPVISQSVQAAEKSKNLASCDFPPILESKAWQQFKTRPVSELSKLIYLIDRFGSTKIEIVYDGHYYKAAFGAQVAKFFLAQNYRKETVDQWVKKWCNVSAGGNLIWVKFPDNRFKLSRDVLKQELEDLEKAIKEDEARKFATPDITAASTDPAADAAAAAVLEKTANAATALDSPTDPLRKTKGKAVALAQ